MLVVMALFACGGKGDGGDGTEAGDAVAGATVYDDCAGCHGDDGKLGVEIGSTAAADLTVVVPSLSDDELTDIIQNGSGDMPARSLDDTETADVIAYLRETFGG